ncbi:MAG: hypothetical protein EXS69_00975 [Candidatus Zambryskibacteria bacterium]|nr:hypothetical protein [Candidatus Zambryskibacteria bacterium]
MKLKVFVEIFGEPMEKRVNKWLSSKKGKIEIKHSHTVSGATGVCKNVWLFLLYEDKELT